MLSVLDRCIELTAAAKQIPADGITAATTFSSLEMDSLDKINLSFSVEEEYDVEIPDAAISTILTIGDMANGVDALIAAKSSATAPTAPSEAQ